MVEMFEKLGLFFDKIKGVTFWDRVLPWRWASIKALSYDAYGEYRKLVESLFRNAEELEQGRTSVATLHQENEQMKVNIGKSEKELEYLRGELDSNKTTLRSLRETLSARDETIRQWEKDISKKQNDIMRLQEKIDNLTKECSQSKEEIASLKQSEANMRKRYEDGAATLYNTQKRLEEDRKKELEDRHQIEISRIEGMKKNWATHQELVKQTIKGICQKQIIEYVEDVPFKGNPDNTIKICDEYVVFDAKAPVKDEIEGFYSYVQKQAEGIKKYAKHEGVKKDIFLVVPTNTIDVIKQFSFNMADYNVYVITIDSLEPIIIALKKIEEYEFANELTPDERENICRIFGKFAHITKRRIQIDHFFIRQFLEVLTKCESEVPSDLLEKAIEFEKAEKLNPPLEKRAKQLTNKVLIADTGKVKREAEAKGLIFPEEIDDRIKALPLYEEEQAEEQDQGNSE